jgi:bifunctional UDP-N-acetylglucosamine pyrophosphorylase / glucosamine-1-phosphate N-acetyltransferase
LTVVVLAAGAGTRMKSNSTPKVLHRIGGRSLLGHVLAAVAATEPDVTAVVVGHRRDEVCAHLAAISPTAVPVVQHEQNGTGHAVRTALEALESGPGTVLVLPADAPLLRPETLTALLAQHAAGDAASTVLTSMVGDPTGYGRVIRGSNELVERIVEHRDASPAELEVAEVSALVYAFDAELLRSALGRLSTDNSQGEQYLPDVVSLLMTDGHPVRAVLAPAEETAGVNDRVQLAAAHRILNDRLLTAHMLAGVSVIDPASTWVDAEVEIAADVTLQPNVQLHGHTVIAAGAVIGPDSTLTDTEVGAGSLLQRVVSDRAVIGAGVSVGPFAYLRPGTVLHDQVHVGTYVEIKKSSVGRGTKVPHLTYMGDATVGAGSNIGAATVFVNYDGVHKHPTVVGDEVFIGSDTMLVAPVTIGDGAQTAAGSVITEDVPAGALGIARGRQRNVEGWVAAKGPRRAEPPAGKPGPLQPDNLSASSPCDQGAEQ